MPSSSALSASPAGPPLSRRGASSAARSVAIDLTVDASIGRPHSSLTAPRAHAGSSGMASIASMRPRSSSCGRTEVGLLRKSVWGVGVWNARCGMWGGQRGGCPPSGSRHGNGEVEVVHQHVSALEDERGRAVDLSSGRAGIRHISTLPSRARWLCRTGSGKISIGHSWAKHLTQAVSLSFKLRMHTPPFH
eukprot:359295-Chlamydomonas_euryale.AAC.7